MNHIKTQRMTTLAMMLASIIVLSAVERMFPPLPLNMRYGLSNIVTMYALFHLGKGDAFKLAFAKSLFVLLTRGIMAGALSLGGGISSLLVLLTLNLLFPQASYLILSVAGALTHNFAQVAIASLITNVNLLPFYAPIMIIAGIAAGSLTGMLLRVVMPIFKTGLTTKLQVKRT